MSGDFYLSRAFVRPSLNLVCNGGSACHVRPRAMSVLVFLARQHGEVVSREEILQAVWGGAAVTDDTLTQATVELRKALEDSGPPYRVIQTVAKRGYRLAVAPEFANQDGTPAATEAQQAFLWGLHHLSQRNWEGLFRARHLFAACVEAEPERAGAHAWLAVSQVMLAYFDPMGRAAAYELAAASARRAADLNQHIADTQLALGMTALFRMCYQESEPHLRRALALDPQSAWSHWALAWLLTARGRHDEAVAEMQQARRLDPVNAYLHTCVGEMYWFAGRHEQALAEYRRMIALDPAFYRSYDLMAMLYENRRTYEEALAIRQMRATVSGRGEAEVRGLRQAHAQAGEQGYWGFLLESSGSYVTCGETAEAPCDFRLSNIFAFLGRHKRALVALEEEVAQGKPALLTEVTPKLEPLRSQPGFRAILQQSRLH